MLYRLTCLDYFHSHNNSLETWQDVVLLQHTFSHHDTLNIRLDVYRDCMGCFPILPYLRKFQSQFQFNSTSTDIKVKITMKINICVLNHFLFQRKKCETKLKLLLYIDVSHVAHHGHQQLIKGVQRIFYMPQNISFKSISYAHQYGTTAF